MEITEQNQSAENQDTNATPAGNNGDQAGKLFTQDDVNRIVSERLAREREKQQRPEEDEREKALREREEAVKARENRYKCEDHLKEINVPEQYRNDLIEALGVADYDTFKAAMDVLGKYFIPKVTERHAPNPANPPILRTNNDAAIAAAFKP